MTDRRPWRSVLALAWVIAAPGVLAQASDLDHLMAAGGERVAHHLAHEDGVVDYQYTGHRSSNSSLDSRASSGRFPLWTIVRLLGALSRGDYRFVSK